MVLLTARHVALIAALVVLPARLFAAPFVIDFDTLGDLDAVTNQFSGLTFSNATVLTAGVSLNEFDFPPHSASNVVFDNGGAISIDFATPIAGFGGFFTYLTPLTITAFDSGHTLLGSASSLFNTNLASFGGGPNEFLELSFLSGISQVVMAGDPFGGSFTLDDATITNLQAPTPVPEPATLCLFGGGLLVIARKRFRRSLCG